MIIYREILCYLYFTIEIARDIGYNKYYTKDKRRILLMNKEKLVIIDGNSLMHRAFYALPPLTNSKGLHTNVIYGFINMLYKLIDELKPTHIGIAFDRKAPTLRHKEYAEYKAGRQKCLRIWWSRYLYLRK